MNCNRFLTLIDAYLDDRLDGADRDAWRHHLATCPSCRERALAEEPALLFTTLPKREPSPAAIIACTNGVRSLIHRDSLVHRLHVRGRRWLAAAATAIILLAGGLFWHAANAPKAARTAAAPHVQVTAPAPEVDVEMPGDHVRIYQFAVGGNDMAVTYVVNPGMEL